MGVFNVNEHGNHRVNTSAAASVQAVDGTEPQRLAAGDRPLSVALKERLQTEQWRYAKP